MKKNDSISITPPNHFPPKIIFTPGGSKSISNRALLLSVLSSLETSITGLSTSEDTHIMRKLLKQEDAVYDAGHAGTCFRFMTAFLAIKPGIQVLTGSSRMKKRPIGPLVEALKSIGASIKYLDKSGYPPIEIGEFEPINYHKAVKIRGDISSQFISALMMVAPQLSEGLEIEITPPLLSMPYINMTALMMQDFGVDVEMTGSTIIVPNGKYQRGNYHVETDWSSASYPIGLMALLRKGELEIPGLNEHSVQGDSVFLEIARLWGLKAEFNTSGLRVTVNENPVNMEIEWDFSGCPDLAPTVMAVNAGLGINGRYSGLRTLLLKESDRISAMRANLAKVGVKLEASEIRRGGDWVASQTGVFSTFKNVTIKPFDDHRIAMACGLWGVLGRIQVQNADVVAKSYPDYWVQLERAGCQITRQD